ncbi:SMP-30/gluconolactonase/LRE family protein [Pedobacter polaris]|uniref:SMP-30/gluconolactonase/LRE family protein n=1 Tax=Pedobacter polaris TaxID=2571273 RepID=A0A4U1CWP3_9SPHI|nr:SMP-30/gluconolactonase/LRE family protein [Pedobacter polaris]TKC10398.1 SMP-30/gluconolactonase/LRE family protein [Pedobacter polaris]
MKLKIQLQLLFILILSSSCVRAQLGENEPLFIQDSLKLISSQFKFTEGASVDKKGNVFFTDQPNNTIWKYSTAGKLSLFTAKAGRANGTYFDKKGNLIACADENFKILSFDKNANPTLVYQNPKHSNLNGPNDLWINRKGEIYFTDPYYQRDYWTRKAPAIVGEKVYFLKATKREEGMGGIIVVEDSLQRPNGIVGTPNGKILYVADAKGGKTYQYDIKPDGSLMNRVMLINQGSDGMTLDEHGNIYLTGNGVTIFDKAGKQIAHINVPLARTSNVCFGGKKRNILFITSGKSIYTLPMTVKGVE